MSQPYLYHTSDLGLNFLSESELNGRFWEWYSDREVCQFNSYGAFPVSRETCAENIRLLQQSSHEVAFAVYHREDDIHIGNIYLQNIHWINRSARLHFLFGEKEYWSQGYAEKAACLVLRHGFDILNLHRVECSVADTNEAMNKLAQKLGMFEEGRRLQALFLNGEFVDSVEYGLLASDWQP